MPQAKDDGRYEVVIGFGTSFDLEIGGEIGATHHRTPLKPNQNQSQN